MSPADPAGELILEVTRASRHDRSPRQFITDEMLAYYRRCEAELIALRAATAENKVAAVFQTDHQALDIAQQKIPAPGTTACFEEIRKNPT